MVHPGTRRMIDARVIARNPTRMRLCVSWLNDCGPLFIYRSEGVSNGVEYIRHAIAKNAVLIIVLLRGKDTKGGWARLPRVD